MQQRRPSPTPEAPARADRDPLTPHLPREVKPIQSIVWVFIAIGVVGLAFALALIVFR